MSMDRSATTFRSSLTAAAVAVETVIERVLPELAGPETPLLEAMRYAALGPGKRIRPFFVLTGARMFGVPETSALRVAAAGALVHAYSLVPADLPAMDEHDMRRGRPSAPRQTSETR